jgi:hypothetical protein
VRAPHRPLLLTEPVSSYTGAQDELRANTRLLWGALLSEGRRQEFEEDTHRQEHEFDLVPRS